MNFGSTLQKELRRRDLDIDRFLVGLKDSYVLEQTHESLMNTVEQNCQNWESPIVDFGNPPEISEVTPYSNPQDYARKRIANQFKMTFPATGDLWLFSFKTTESFVETNQFNDSERFRLMDNPGRLSARFLVDLNEFLPANFKEVKIKALQEEFGKRQKWASADVAEYVANRKVRISERVTGRILAAQERKSIQDLLGS